MFLPNFEIDLGFIESMPWSLSMDHLPNSASYRPDITLGAEFLSLHKFWADVVWGSNELLWVFEEKEKEKERATSIKG